MSGIHAYVRALTEARDERVTTFIPDPDSSYPEHTQICYWLIATCKDKELFSGFAGEVIARWDIVMMPAVLLNPLSDADMVARILDQERLTVPEPVQSVALAHPSVSSGNLAHWARYGSARVRTVIAGRRDIPDDVAARLANDTDPTVRARISMNTSVPDHLRALAALAL